MFNMRSLVAFVLLLSFGSCFSMNEEEGVDFPRNKDKFEKDPWSDEDSAVLKTVGFHRKILVRNPFYRPVSSTATAVATPSSSSPQHSPKPVSTKTSTQDVSSLPLPSPTFTNSPTPVSSSDSSVVVPVVVSSATGIVFLLLLATGVYYFRSKTGKPVVPWRTGLSGPLQKAFITGISSLKRSEIEAACEDFSNVIGSCPIGKLFKGTLSSGVEIAVASIDTTSAKDWKDNTEIQFRKKIEMLSKINHKNFVNLLGFCEEKEPFTRILIFEYAPYGSLFEHLHYKESEHLDWKMRLRILMGLSYCLDYMHKLNPPIAHTNLISSSLQLTEDYSVKLSDFSFGPSETTIINPEDNIYSFGLLLFELITGKLPEIKPDEILEFLTGENLAKMVDPTLESADDNKIENISEVIKSCLKTDPKERPTMREVTRWLREITGISPNDATPKLSPLWWAELELLSMAD